MPPRADLSPDEALRRAERKRESDKLAARRYRARGRVARQTNATTVSTTRQTDGALMSAPAPARVVPLRSSTDTDSSPVGHFGRILAPFAARGYVHKPEYLERLARDNPLVDLIAAAYELTDWLEQPDNAKRRCNTAFVGNWVRETQRRATRGAGTPAGRPRRAARPVKLSGPQAVEAVFAAEGIYVDAAGRCPGVGLGDEETLDGVPRLVRQR